MRVSLAGVGRSFGAHTVLDSVNLTLGLRSRLGLVGPNGAGKSTLLRLARRARRAGCGHRRADAADADGRLPAAGARPGPGRDPPRATSPGARASRTRRPTSSGMVRSGARTRTPPRSSASSPSAAPISRRARARPAPTSACPSRSSRRRRRSRAARRRARRSRRCFSPASTSCCSTSRRTTSTSTGSTDSSASSTSSRAGSPSSRTTAPSSTAPSRGSPRSIRGPGGCASTRAAGATSRLRAIWPARSSTRRSSTRRSERREVEALLHARRNQARAGGGFLAKATGGADRRGTHALSGKVRQAKRALERVEHVEKPYEPWELHLSLAAKQRRATASRRSRGPSPSAAAFRLGPDRPRSRSGRAGRDHGPERQRQVDAARRCCSGSCRRRRALGRSAAQPCSALSTSAAPPTTATESLLAAFTARTGLLPEEARTLLAKFNLGADHVGRACTTLSPGERTRAHLAELMAGGVNCLVLDEPTNHLDLEAIEELESALEAYEGTLVVVSHDRRFLEAVSATRSIDL